MTRGLTGLASDRALSGPSTAFARVAQYGGHRTELGLDIRKLTPQALESRPVELVDAGFRRLAHPGGTAELRQQRGERILAGDRENPLGKHVVEPRAVERPSSVSAGGAGKRIRLERIVSNGCRSSTMQAPARLDAC